MAEVTYSNVARVVNQNVGWFKVAVNNARGVHELYSAQHVVGDGDYMVLIERNGVTVFDQLIHVRAEVVLNKEQLVEDYAFISQLFESCSLF